MADERNIKLERDLKTVLESLKDIQYGTISLIYQDGKLVRIEKLEKYKVTDLQ